MTKQSPRQLGQCCAHTAYFQARIEQALKLDKRLFVKQASQMLKDRESPLRVICADCIRWRIILVELLEKTMKTSFSDTGEFNEAVEGYSAGCDLRKGSLGTRIRRARKKLKLTAAQLGREFGLSHAAIIQYEKGRRHPPRKIIDWLESKGL